MKMVIHQLIKASKTISYDTTPPFLVIFGFVLNGSSGNHWERKSSFNISTI
jgi:hypothetical protein